MARSRSDQSSTDRQARRLAGVRGADAPSPSGRRRAGEEGRALDLSVPVVKAMLAKARPDLINWGAVIPNLTISNLAQRGADRSPRRSDHPGVLDDHGLLHQHDGGVPGGVACWTTVAAAWRWSAGRMGHEPHPDRPVAAALGRPAPAFMEARTAGRAAGRRCAATRLSDVRACSIPEIKNRATGKSMGEHTEDMAKELGTSAAPSRTNWRSPATRTLPPPAGPTGSSTTWSFAWTRSAATASSVRTPAWRR